MIFHIQDKETVLRQRNISVQKGTGAHTHEKQCDGKSEAEIQLESKQSHMVKRNQAYELQRSNVSSTCYTQNFTAH